MNVQRDFNRCPKGKGNYLKKLNVEPAKIFKGFPERHTKLALNSLRPTSTHDCDVASRRTYRDRNGTRCHSKAEG